MILTEESDVTGRTPWHLTNLFTQDRQHYTTMEGGNRRICYSGIYNSIRIFYFRNKQIENLVLGLLIELRTFGPSFSRAKKETAS